MIKQIFLTLLLITLTSCGIETYDANKAFEHWENGNIGDDVEIINGQFWKSGHWTYEYVVFLEIKPTKRWIDNFFEIYRAKENHIGTFNSENKTHQTDEPNWFENPKWFNPNSDFEVYRGYGGDYYWNEDENILLFYEMQL